MIGWFGGICVDGLGHAVASSCQVDFPERVARDNLGVGSQRDYE